MLALKQQSIKEQCQEYQRCLELTLNAQFLHIMLDLLILLVGILGEKTTFRDRPLFFGGGGGWAIFWGINCFCSHVGCAFFFF